MTKTFARSIAVAAFATTLAAAGSARAAYFFEFGQSSYTAGPNVQVSVPLFLRETTTTALATQGLVGGDVRLLFNEPTRTTSPAQVTGRATGPSFDSPNSPQPTIVAATATASGVASIVQSSFDPALSTAGRILLGTYTFTTTGTAGVTRLRATDYDATADGLVLANGTVLDAVTADGTATITTVVPEPATFAAAAGGLALVARRRRTASRLEPRRARVRA